MSLTTAPIPYAEPAIDPPAHPGREVLTRPLPTTLSELTRYAAADPAFSPPHWIRLRAPRDPAVAARLLDAYATLAPLVAAAADPALDEALAELTLRASDPDAQRFAAATLEARTAPGAEPMLYATAAHGLGPRFDALFAREDVPLAARLLRLTAMRDHGGMAWSDAFSAALFDALPTLPGVQAAWVIRFIAELADPRARRFLERALATLEHESLRADIVRFLASPPRREHDDDDALLPTSMDALELGAIDPRKPARQVACLARIAELDWPRARRLASSISTESWRLDELVGALLNHGSLQVMADDLLARDLLPRPTEPAPGLLSARELMRAAGRVVRFDITATEGVVDHDALAYRLADAAAPALTGVDFLEEYLPDGAIRLHAFDGPTHYQLDLDTRRWVIDPYGLVGLLNTLLRARSRPERCLLAAEDKGLCDVVVGPEPALRQLVDAGLLWIRAGFKT